MRVRAQRKGHERWKNTDAKRVGREPPVSPNQAQAEWRYRLVRVENVHFGIVDDVLISGVYLVRKSSGKICFSYSVTV